MSSLSGSSFTGALLETLATFVRQITHIPRGGMFLFSSVGEQERGNRRGWVVVRAYIPCRATCFYGKYVAALFVFHQKYEVNKRASGTAQSLMHVHPLHIFVFGCI